ncbi:MAG: class I SAM-dependent methyltransferase [Proteobacteria bacterium]|nr:class I SAM-dependent methyltransferase [Pseudomonadota bacterium]
MIGPVAKVFRVGKIVSTMTENFKKFARSICYGIAPKQVSALQRYRYLKSEARKLNKKTGNLSTHQERFSAVQESPFVTQQIESEFIQVMEKVKSMNPRCVVEIGAFKGGTLSLFAQMSSPDCRFLSVDIAYRLPEQLALKQLALKNQKINCISGDSSASQTIQKVKQWLRNDQIDVLFIDGDHSFNGVKADFENYSPFVRPGGLIIFHDIVEDYTTRFGKPTPSYTGGVPRFWNELKALGFSTEEVIADPSQDGFGIGLMVKAQAGL